MSHPGMRGSLASMHSHHSLPHKPQKISFQPVTPTRNGGQILWIHQEMSQPCHSHLGGATRPMALPPTSFPAQSHLSCTLGKPSCSPCPNPALPMGDRACTHASLSIYMHRDFFFNFFLHTFLVTIAVFYFFSPNNPSINVTENPDLLLLNLKNVYKCK